ncbi:MAG TPA: endonuclease/exonuclease/phosphatase family protein [Longimicrobiales bacterium]
MRFGLMLGLALFAGCQTQKNYVTVEGPRQHGEPPPHLVDTAPAETLKVVSFNIEFALQVERALAVLREEPELKDADIVLLQEMDGPGTRYIARALGMYYVYYPATQHMLYGRDFGNAVLSRWPIVADRKLVLPHKARVYRTLRTATAATIRIGADSVRVYSTHLGTVANINARQRSEQLQTVLADAAPFDRVILGGDMNHGAVGGVARRHGYLWPTENGPPTATIGRLDHIFFKGLSIPQSDASGTVFDVRAASDHLPIWAIAILRQK